MWYNESIENVVLGSATNTPNRIHSLEECIVDILRPLLPQSKPASNTPYACTACGETDPGKFYHRSNGRPFGPFCKPCRLLQYSAGRKNQRLRKRFGLTAPEYEAMFEAQGGVCAICKLPETRMDNSRRKIRALAVDHDHETGAIRQLLCGSCNYLLGYAKENAELLQAASEYLRRHKEGGVTCPLP